MTEAPRVMGERERVVVRTLSDWHVGTGQGIPGDVQAVVRRDGDGFPYVPGTSLTGVLRDACRVVAAGLDDGADTGVWQRWHTRIFGAAPTQPHTRTGRTIDPAVVGIDAARLAGEVRAALTRSTKTDDLVLRRAGVAIDPGTGRALDKALRFVQVARAGLELRAELTLDPMPRGEGERMAVTAMLSLGAAWCAQLGADRRRGLGRVEIRIGEHDGARWARWLAESAWSPPEPRPRSGPVVSGTVVPEGFSGDWVAADLVVTAQGPLRVPHRVTGNIVRGLDYLPGSLLLPWLSQRWGRDVVDAAVWHRALIVRDALPEVNGCRGVPAPLSMYVSRQDEHQYHFMSGESGPAGDDVPSGSRQVRGRYTDGAVAEGVVTLVSSPVVRVSHNTVDPVRQRPTATTGLFELEVIPAGTRLRGRILVRESLLAALRESGDPWEKLTGPARLGARRRGEYGAATVSAAPAATIAEQRLPTGEWSLWAVSDLIVRSRTGRLSADPHDAAAAIGRALGVPVELVSVIGRTRRRDGWHGTWQLPRESLTGLVAGTLLRLRFPGRMPTAEAWRELLTSGVGERTVEGYGEVATGLAMLEQRSVRTVPSPSPPVAGPSSEVDGLPEVVRAAVLAERTRAALPDSRGSHEYGALAQVLRRLSRSQRGDWRATCVAVAVAGDLAPIAARIDQTCRGNLDRRQHERLTAQVINCLIGRRPNPDVRSWWDVLAELGVELTSDADRARAIAAVVTDVIDGLRRDGETA